ncbi:MAG: response regulator [Gemmatimonadetes bacterium]|nr:response regulator [Gemmatimonadota bacterium]
MQQTILLVEDNEDNRAIYRTILNYGGFNVLEAADGEAGMESALRNQPALILMDVSIPKIDGWEATRRLKLDSATGHIPIVALTAHALDTDRARAAEVGCDGYLAKPVEPRRVLEEVRRLLALRASAGPVE